MNEERKDGEIASSMYTVGSEKNLVPVRSRAACFKKKGKKSLIFVLLALIMAFLLIADIGLALLYSESNRPQDLCDSEQCLRIAASLKKSMDTSVDPCDDFYGYACGRWSEDRESSTTGFENSWFSQKDERVQLRIRNLLQKNLTDRDVPWAVTQAKKFYASCIDTNSHDSLSPLYRILMDLDLPEVPPWISGEDTIDIVRLLARARKLTRKDIFIGFRIEPDPKNTSRNIVQLDVPSSSGPLPSYNTEVEKMEKHVMSYYKNLEEELEENDNDDSETETSPKEVYILSVIREIVDDRIMLNCSSDYESEVDIDGILNDVTTIMYRMDKFFRSIAESHKDETVADEDVNDENYFLVDSLQELTDSYVNEIDTSVVPRKFWRPYIEELFKDVENFDFNEDQVLVRNIGYMKDCFYLLSLAKDTHLETTIWWIIVDMMVPHSSERLRSYWIEYLHQIAKFELDESRSLYCAGVVREMMTMAVSWLYVDPDFHENKGAKVLEMLEGMRSAFSDLVAKADWMDDVSKSGALEKLQKMIFLVGYPDWLFDTKIINEYYEGVNMEEDSYLENMMTVVRVMSDEELRSLHEINYPNETFWGAEPTDVNAANAVSVNQITIPAGILQFPFYELGLEALNYGALGMILGHELMHGFDTTGRMFDANNHAHQWWNNLTIDQYNNKIECFVKQYGDYYIEEVNDHIDGKLTLDENIADNGGLRETVLAYKKWQAKHGQEPMLPGFTNLTHEQLLFLGFAHSWCQETTADVLRSALKDSHCPHHVRVRGVLTNSEEFSEAWKCPRGSAMNPEKKCLVW